MKFHLVPGDVTAVSVAGLGKLDAKDFKHIVVFPDTHGDFAAFLHSLYLAYARIEPPGTALRETEFRESIGTSVGRKEAHSHCAVGGSH
jgi:hypothetical protein